MSDPRIFWWLAASVANSFAINSNNIKTLLGNGFNAFFIKFIPLFGNVLEVYLKFLLIALFHAIEILIIFIVAEELCTKALQNFDTWVLVNYAKDCSHH